MTFLINRWCTFQRSVICSSELIVRVLIFTTKGFLDHFGLFIKELFGDLVSQVKLERSGHLLLLYLTFKFRGEFVNVAGVLHVELSIGWLLLGRTFGLCELREPWGVYVWLS